MTVKVCKYKKCKNDVLPGEIYCKYHKRLREIELQGPAWLNAMIEEMKSKKRVR